MRSNRTLKEYNKTIENVQPFQGWFDMIFHSPGRHADGAYANTLAGGNADYKNC